MTIANNVVAKLFVAFVAASMLFTLATPAKAATAEELQAQIAALMAQIAALQGSPAMSSAACTFTRALTVGSEGEDVKCLQNYLTPAYFNHAAGATGYFGSVTAAAVAAWQTANGVMPAVGYFGPVSQAKYNSLMASAPVTPTTPGSDDSDDEVSGDLSGEASLVTFEVGDGDDSDDVEEGSENMQVAEFNVEFNDGDAMITRLDLALVATTDGNDDVDPWDTFEEVTLWVDGDEIASMDASDQDEYLNEDDGTMRFSGLDIVAMEDEEVTIIVAVTVGNSVDGVSDGADWSINAESVRFVDADDVTTTDTTTDDLDGVATADFTIEEAGAGDSLDLETSTEDPDARTIALDEDNNVEDTIFAFELSAEDSDGDIEINEIVIYATGTVGANMDDLVNDFRIEIDGESFGAESYVGTGLSVRLVFDINGDVTVSADETATVVLFADFEDMELADEGATIVADVRPTDIDAEGADDVVVGGSQKISDTHTLRTQGLDLGDVTDGQDASDSTQVVSGVATDDNYGTMFLTYEVTAFGDDLYVKANQASRGASTTAGLAYVIESADAVITTGAASVSYDIDGADETNGYFLLEDGETYEMTVTVNSFNPATGAGGTFNLQILTVGFADSEVNATNTEAPSDLNDYESDEVAIQS